tara:strand:- start:28289 stop:31063 length:2775 start_codon:yes stop_codon:yes gene_type:complete
MTDFKTQLLEKEEALSKQLWLREMQLKVHTVFRGEKDRETLCRDILVSLAEVTHADVGVFYFMENNTLKFISGYAFPSDRALNQTIAIGEGIIGLAASTKEIQRFDHLEQDDLVLESSTQTLRVRAIMAVPLTYEGDILGVIELGACHAFFDDSFDFMEQIRESIAISLNMVLEREKVRRLLSETQAQAEQLKQQATQLQVSNETLKQQAHELKASQGELEQTNEELAGQRAALLEQTKQLEENNQALEEYQESLEEKTQELENSSRYKSEFLANMSHELRTPLNSILVLSQLFIENKKNHLDQNQVKSAQTMFKCGNDLLTLINDILDLSKVEANRLEIDFENILTNGLVDNLNNLFQAVADKKGLIFNVVLDKKFPEAFVSDVMRLEQILRNFISNALKFTDAGEIKVLCTVSKPSDHFHLATLKKEGGLSFCVKDSGIGIPQSKLNDIFTAFQQVDGSTARKYGGTGLGLTISNKLALLLGGEIYVKSAYGQGSMFTLTLPLSIEPTEATSTDKLLLSPMGAYVEKQAIADDRDQLNPKKRTLLIIEDDVNFASILSDFAHKNSFQVISAATGPTGLDYAEKYAPDGILLDVQLPDLDGLSVLKALKENVATRYIPIHVMTVESCEEQAMSLGAVSFIQKPISKHIIEQTYQDLMATTKKVKKHLVLLEDDDTEQAIVREFFTDYPVVIKAFKTVTPAFNYLKKHKVDGIILDYMLKKGTGLDLLRKIKHEANFSCPPVIIYTNQDLTQFDKNTFAEFSQTFVAKGIHAKEKLLREANVFFQQITQHSKKSRYMHQKKKPFDLPIILLVDDDERNLFALKEIFDAVQALIITASNGKEAVELYRAYPETALIIMDMMMPVMNGYDATQVIRKMNTVVPIIALTAKAMKGEREKCMESGCTDYLAKPVDVQQLLSLVQVWLG